MTSKKPNILFLADTTHPANAVADHIQIITSGEDFTWHLVNPLIIKTIDKLDLTPFDAVGLHYSIKPYNNYYLSKGLKRKLKEYQGAKFLFLQDEYQRVNEVQKFLFDLSFDVLFTLVNKQILDLAYPDPKLRKLNKVPVLTAYVTDEMKGLETIPIADRKIDVSYRSRRNDYWLGSLTYEKEWIAEQFVAHTKHRGLVLDISIEEEDRIYGQNWLNLLTNSRAVLGTESGASIWDFDRSAEIKTKKYLKQHKNASFEEVYQNVLKDIDGKIVYSAISPRVFEAAATKTPMIMFPGYYSGVCQPDKHYILLQKDFSNLEEVLCKLKDIDYLQFLANNTFNDLILSDKYSQQQFSKLITTEIYKIITFKTDYFSANLLAVQLLKNNLYYRRLNKVRLLITELHFIINKLWDLLHNPQKSISERVNNLYKGLKRYLLYLSARYSK